MSNINTLIIYDETGFIISQLNGSVREPVGVPFLWVDIPDNKYVIKVNVNSTLHEAVLADKPKTETDLLKDEINNLTLHQSDVELDIDYRLSMIELGLV